MNNMDRITSSYHRVLAAEYDSMIVQMNSSFENLTEKEKKFIEFRKTCTVPINSFEEKVAFMMQFNEKIKSEQKKEEIERLKQEKEKLVEAAKKRYDSKSSLWKFSHKKLNPERINFDSMTNSEINELYNDTDNKKIR